MTTEDFEYQQAFARNQGWVTADEQQQLRRRCVAIAGLGGVGGHYALALARLGVGHLRLADFDRFELVNFNRQAGAGVSRLQQPKLDVIARLALDINPELEIERYPNGIHGDNVDVFLEGADLYLDGLDFFALPARRQVFAACHRLGIPATTVAPLGMSTALVNFLPGGMTFEDYFQLDDQPEEEQLLKFLIGLAPAMLHRGYLVDPSVVDLVARRGPSTPMSCELCAGVAVTEALKILLHRGRVTCAPKTVQFDAYTQRLRHTWRPGGNRHPLQRVALTIMRRQLARDEQQESAQADNEPHERAIDAIVDLARWAPSGDNTQPWAFEIRDDNTLIVHGHDTRHDCVYDFEGRASQIALGALLQSIELAAADHGLRADVGQLPSEDAQYRFSVKLRPDPQVAPDPRTPYIRTRVTQRRPMRTRPLHPRQKEILEEAAGPDFELAWFEQPQERLRMARLMARNGRIRLTTPEAFSVHQQIIEWGETESTTRIPERAVGVDPLTGRIMRWALQSWERASVLNRYFGGTLLPRMQLDLLPAYCCAGHFVLLRREPPREPADQIAAGRALQRFWLEATRQGLLIQPEYTPLVFAGYTRADTPFTDDPRLVEQARAVTAELEHLLGEDRLGRAVFMGRIGSGRRPRARSTRKPLSELLREPPPPDRSRRTNRPPAELAPDDS